MEIPAILYELRTKNRITQEGMADVIGVDYTTYSGYESGKTALKFHQAIKIAEFFKISLDELYNYGKKSKSKVEEPFSMYDTPKKAKGRTASLIIELDGQKGTAEFWIDKIKKLNAALA
jgi:transcriptional regulator with XRE-family HTH domain